jgi:hypothetical protein
VIIDGWLAHRKHHPPLLLGLLLAIFLVIAADLLDVVSAVRMVRLVVPLLS